MNVVVNGEPRVVDDSARLRDVLADPGQPLRRGVAVAVDGAVVPKGRIDNTALHEGARIEVVTAVQGG